MIEITYSTDAKKFLLTIKEFKEALSAWKNKENYWCPRIEALLSPFIAFAETPEIYWHRKVYVELKTGREYFLTESGKLYNIIGKNRGDVAEIDLKDPKTREFLGKMLIKQEDFHNLRDDKEKECLMAEIERQMDRQLESPAKSVGLSPVELKDQKGKMIH